MKPRRTLEALLTIAGAVFLLIAAKGRHPYGFYVMLRLACTVGAIYWACRVYVTGLRGWSLVFAAVALLMNPFLPIRMPRAQWQPVDFWLGLMVLAWCAYWLFRSRSAQQLK